MTSQPPFPITLFAQLLHRLRHANARYDFIANQCRHTQRRTHHAQRRARGVGLSIDTDKARAAFQRLGCGPEAHVVTTSEPGARSIWESPSPVWTDKDLDFSDADALEDESEGEVDSEDASTPEMLAEKGPLAVRPRTDEASPALSPLDLALRTVDDEDLEDNTTLPPPGAPRWKTKPLPHSDSDVGTGHVGTGLTVARTYGPVPVRRGLGRGIVRTTHASNASLPMILADAVPYYPITLGIAVPTRPLKRKLRDVDADAMHNVCAFRDRDTGGRWDALQVLG